MKMNAHDSPTFQVVDSVPVWRTPEPAAVRQILNCKKDAAHVALMADHHQGYAVPIGGVVAYEDKVSPSGVGVFAVSTFDTDYVFVQEAEFPAAVAALRGAGHSVEGVTP